jgi:hypothetical protein
LDRVQDGRSHSPVDASELAYRKKEYVDE